MNPSSAQQRENYVQPMPVILAGLNLLFPHPHHLTNNMFVKCSDKLYSISNEGTPDTVSGRPLYTVTEEEDFSGDDAGENKSEEQEIDSDGDAIGFATVLSKEDLESFFQEKIIERIDYPLYTEYHPSGVFGTTIWSRLVSSNSLENL